MYVCQVQAQGLTLPTPPREENFSSVQLILKRKSGFQGMGEQGGALPSSKSTSGVFPGHLGTHSLCSSMAGNSENWKEPKCLSVWRWANMMVHLSQL